jgi:uncharacterized damage-inducible protein DinB
MDLRQHLRLMSDWHVWASNKLYDIVELVPEYDYRRDSGLFFKSIHGTLNHLLVVERLWRGRLTGQPFQLGALSDELEADRVRLKGLLLESARAWRPFVDAMSDEQLATDLTYESMSGKSYTLPRASIVHTMFTHGSHHRGQISTVLTQLGQAAPEMDHPYFLAELPREKLHAP